MHTTTIEKLHAGQTVELFRGWPQRVLADPVPDAEHPGGWAVPVLDVDEVVSTHRLPAGTLYLLAAEESHHLMC